MSEVASNDNLLDTRRENKLFVTKRDNRTEPLNLENIRKQTRLACGGLNVSEEEFINLTKIHFYDGIPTREIQDILIKTAQNLIEVDRPDYTYVAGRLKLYDLYHKIKHDYGVPGSGDVYEKVSIKDYFNKYGDLLDDFYKTYTDEEIEELNSCIDSSKDLLFNIVAVYVLTTHYLNRVGYEVVNGVKHKIKNKIVELPQHMLMVLAMFNCHKEDKSKRIDLIKEQYYYLSNQYIIPASPQLANGRIKNGSVASCLVTSMADNIQSIFEIYGVLAFGSKAGAGWGLDISRIRSLGAPVGTNSNASKGKVKLCRILDGLANYIDQGGKRIPA